MIKTDLAFKIKFARVEVHIMGGGGAGIRLREMETESINQKHSPLSLWEQRSARGVVKLLQIPSNDTRGPRET